MTENPPALEKSLTVPLGTLAPGAKGIVAAVVPTLGGTAEAQDLERQLLEIGFVEGVRVELLQQGPFGDPLAVRIDGRLTIALRRREANAILIAPLA